MTVVNPAPVEQEDDEMLVPQSDVTDNHHPMEVVAQSEPANNVENQAVEDPPTSRFTWRIENFSRLNTKKHYSDAFVVGGYKWRILIFPKGNNVDHLSMYLDVADANTLPYGWSRYAQFNLAVVNQLHSKYTVRKDTQHQFNARESDWGFTPFMPLSELYDPSRGYLVNDAVVIEAEVAVRKIVDYWSHDSKKETGYVGLKNQGATCYMNSLLQTLFHIPYFRKAVYHMPTTENDMPTASIPLALQSLFYKLQYSDSSVATKELTKSFGWDTYDSFMQHDVQELNRVLCEKLEEKMKATVVEGTIQQLFEGHHMNYIECINVDYKSTRKESFYDLQLDVKGCRDVYASFDKYVEVEKLEGDNKYHAEHYGLQDARKGVLFIDFPPVLQLQLKRFEYDFMRDTMVKINDRYEFPLELDLDRENGKYLSPDADRSVRNLYTLHSVLVHSGGVHGGHYYAYIRPTLSDQWFKFDDERVTKEDMKRALEEQYGGEEELPQTNPGFNNMPFKFTKYSNAYMLVYIRESDKEKILCNVDEKDIAEHLRERLKREQEEKEHKKKEKAEAHLYTIIKVARDEDLAEQIGKEIYFDLVDHEKVKCFRIQKQMPFNLFKEEVAKEFGIPAQFQRFWLWAKRQNHTYRPNKKKNPSLSSSCLQVKEEEKSNQRQRKNVIVTMTKTRDLTACFEDRHLPAELLSEILSRLPVKSLLRFRCVSKSWCSLVDDDGDFARLHLNTFKNNCDETRLSVFESGIDDRCVVRSSDIFEPISETPLPFLPGHDRLPWSILSSIDGLILLKYWGNCSRNCSSGRRIGGKFNLLKLWNPSIREFRDVPPPPVSGDGCPSLIDIEIGLGYDPLSKDYKHVKLIFASPTVLHSVAIYTVGAGSWKMIPFKGNGSSSSWPIWHRDPWVSFPTSNVYLEGSLYFFAKNSNDIKTWELVCFDMSKEVFSSITTPDDPYFRWGVTLVLIDGRSSVAVLNMYSDEKSVWVLERETMNWTKRWSFISENTRILYVKKNDDILTLRIREAISDEKTGDELRVTREEVVSYSLEKPEYKIWPLKRAIKSRWIKHVYGNVESLILHKRNMNV